ncbi:MAG: TSUP family transporter [Serratia inhibens]|uniref:TSUP family transporter n=1 Tax=Serratia inhibens TaxID=2338073 RepID=UPI003C7E95AB
MDIHIILIVALFAVIQSVFGMGLLVFGTPTLLLMGYPFSDVLSILLPPSLTISLIQMLRQGRQQKQFAFSLLKFCLPVLIVSLCWTLFSKQKLNFHYIIAAILLFTAISRYSTRISAFLSRFIENNTRKYLVVMGLVHGMTNMGGSLLSTYAVTRHQLKNEVLGCIVTGYLLFGIVQLGTLHYINALNVSLTTPVTCLVAGSMFMLVGSRLYNWINEHFYQKVFTLFMLVYAALLIFH